MTDVEAAVQALKAELELARAEIDRLTAQNKTLGDLVHKRGGDIAELKGEVKRLTAALEAARNDALREAVAICEDWGDRLGFSVECECCVVTTQNCATDIDALIQKEGDA